MIDGNNGVYGEYCIIVTFKCDWKCTYCMSHRYEKPISHEDILEDIDGIPENSHVVLSGGEPGLLERERLSEYVSLLQDKGCHVVIATNGKLFDYPEVVDMVDEIYYHCSMDMEIDDVVNKEYKHKTEFIIVVSDLNFHNLDAFMEKHDDIYIVITPATYDSRRDYLSKKNITKILIKYRKYMTKSNLELVLEYGARDIDRIVL
jgi:organic radical activating enzyme